MGSLRFLRVPQGFLGFLTVPFDSLGFLKHFLGFLEVIRSFTQHVVLLPNFEFSKNSLGVP